MIKYLIRHFLNTMRSERGDFGGDDEERESAGRGITQVGEDVYARGKLTGAEEEELGGAFDLGKIIKQIMLSRMGLGAAPSGYLSPTQQYLEGTGELGRSLYEQILSETQDPYKYYESTLQPQLTSAMDYINRQAQQRGLIRSGIPLEQGSRAAVELAIQEANARQQARAQALARAGTLTEYIGGQGQSNLANLGNLYGAQRGYGLSEMQRQSQAAQAAAPYLSYPYERQLAGGGNYGMLGGGLGAGLGAVAGGLTAMALPGGQAFLVPLGAGLGAGLGGGAGSMIGR